MPRMKILNSIEQEVFELPGGTPANARLGSDRPGVFGAVYTMTNDAFSRVVSKPVHNSVRIREVKRLIFIIAHR